MGKLVPTHGWAQFDRYVGDQTEHGIKVTVIPKKSGAYLVFGQEEEHICQAPLHGYKDCSCDCCLETCGHLRQLRVGRFHAPWDDDPEVVTVVEEYLLVEDQRLGLNIVHIAVYESCKRPDLKTTILEPSTQYERAVA